MFSMENFLKKIRESRNMTQEQLADSLGTTQATVCKIENGQQRLNDVLIKKLVSLLNCSADELLFGLKTTVSLSEREKKLLDYFRGCSDEGKDYLLHAGALEVKHTEEDEIIKNANAS